MEVRTLRGANRAEREVIPSIPAGGTKGKQQKQKTHPFPPEADSPGTHNGKTCKQVLLRYHFLIVVG